MRRILTLSLMGLMYLANLSYAQDALLDPPSNSLDTLGEEEFQEFLPVDEAYQSMLTLEDKVLKVNWQIADGYYLYKHRFTFTLDKSQNDRETLQAEYEKGKVKYDEYFEKDVEAFYHNTEITAPLPALEKSATLVMTSQGCADAGLCYPPQKHYFKVDTDTGVVTAIDKSQVKPLKASLSQTTNSVSANDKQSSAFLPYILLLAALGGMILNLMPCVFPVLSIKALSLANAHHNGHNQRLHGWVYTAGVMSTFILIAALMLAVRASGAAVGWGFQLQSPLVVSMLAYLFFVMGLSLSGLINFGSGFMGMGQSLTSGSGFKSSFFTGVLATVVASPCTAPFMGTALGYAITQPPWVALSVFGALGFGMALPFLALSYSPRLSSLMPAPGAWMDTLKQALAFPLYLTSVWLLWVLGRQSGSDAAAALVAGAVLLAAGFWLANRPTRSTWGTWTRRIATVALLAVAVSAPFLSPKSKPGVVADENWQAYSPQRLEELVDQGEPVMINMTAAWCITCLANERIAFTERVMGVFKEKGFHTMKGDWTNYDETITELLTKFGRSGVPLYVVYPADNGQNPVVLPQLLTEDIVLEHIEKSSASAQTAQN